MLFFCRHETVHVNLKDKPDWLFERNPLGAVPILEHKGRVVYESAVCEEFLEEAFPESVTGTHALLPSCPYERATVRLLMLKFDKVTYTVHLIDFLAEITLLYFHADIMDLYTRFNQAVIPHPSVAFGESE